MISPAYVAAMVLLGIGLHTVMFRPNLIKIAMGVSIAASGANLLFVALGHRAGAEVPIFTMARGSHMALPMPQAAVMTSIVIGLAITALMLAFALAYYKSHGTLDSRGGRLEK